MTSAHLKTSTRPLYQQIKDRIERRISSGEWAPGHKIPSENEIVRDLGVSRMTVNRALREMAQEGFLLRVAGVGTFVAEAPRQTSLVELRDIAEEVRGAGDEHQARVLLQQRQTLDASTAQRLECSAGDSACRVVLVHSRNGLPIQYEDRWIAAEVLPDFSSLDFSRATPSEVLLERITADEMEHEVLAVQPSAEVRRHLAINESEPCLQLSRRTWNQGKVVTAAVLTYPGSRYGLAARYSLRANPENSATS